MVTWVIKKMKNKIILVFKILFIVLLIAWVTGVVIDYTRAKDQKKPMVCLAEKRQDVSVGKYYECTSFGYVYYEVEKNDSTKDFGFTSVFSKKIIKDKYGVE